MDQTCPVVHKSRRPQARLKTVTVFYIHCATYSYTCNDDRKRTYLRQKKDMALPNFELRIYTKLRAAPSLRSNIHRLHLLRLWTPTIYGDIFLFFIAL
jgi:hypothetical protein